MKRGKDSIITELRLGTNHTQESPKYNKEFR